MRLTQIFLFSTITLGTASVWAQSTTQSQTDASRGNDRVTATTASTSVESKAPTGNAVTNTPASSEASRVAPTSASSATATALASATTPSASAATQEQAQPAAAESSRSEMDLSALEDRLVDTDAIGFFTKLELKSQIDELTEKFRELHALDTAPSDASLAILREEFDLLLLKVLTLLQDDDPELHHDVALARPQIWETFADPELFAKL